MFIIQCPILWYAKVCALPSARSSSSWGGQKYNSNVSPITTQRKRRVKERKAFLVKDARETDGSVTLSSSLVVLAWHRYVARRKFPLGCWRQKKSFRPLGAAAGSRPLLLSVFALCRKSLNSSPLNHIRWNWQQPSSYPHPAGLWGRRSAEEIHL